MKPEQRARTQIDQLLQTAGWAVQDISELNLGAAIGVAIREYPLESGPADYLLFVDRKAVGVVEAKPEGTTLSGVTEQSSGYLASVPDNVPHDLNPLPFAYETTGVETFFRDLRDPDSRSRRVFAFHKPETLLEWLSQEKTLRARLKMMPPLIEKGLYGCQIEAIKNLEKSFARSKPRALVQMATGSGKTFTAVSFVYRLIKHANGKRVLFLVDRSNLGRQTLREFQQYVTPDDGRKFTELYNVQHMTSNSLDPVSRVCITTIQRLYSMLRGESEFDEELEETSLFDLSSALSADGLKPKQVSYNPKIPIEAYDFIITDECHRSIYHLWRQVLEYFDAFTIGLTATPSKQTLGFFNNNLVMEYSHERAVADGVNVGYEVYRIRTNITEKGGKVEAKNWVDKRDKLTRKLRWEQLDNDLVYTSSQLDKDVVSPDQIRTVIRTFRDKLFTEIFPGRKEVPKTLVFAKDDAHAEDIVHIVREEFDKGKLTLLQGNTIKDVYDTGFEKALDLVTSSIDLIMTGDELKISDLVITKTMGREISKYNALFPHVSAALQLNNKGKTLKKGDNVGFIYTDSKHKNPLQRVRAIDASENYNNHIDQTELAVQYDREKYLQLLLDAAETILAPFGFDRRLLGDGSTRITDWKEILRKEREQCIQVERDFESRR